MVKRLRGLDGLRAGSRTSAAGLRLMERLRQRVLAGLVQGVPRAVDRARRLPVGFHRGEDLEPLLGGGDGGDDGTRTHDPLLAKQNGGRPDGSARCRTRCGRAASYRSVSAGQQGLSRPSCVGSSHLKLRRAPTFGSARHIAPGYVRGYVGGPVMPWEPERLARDRAIMPALLQERREVLQRGEGGPSPIGFGVVPGRATTCPACCSSTHSRR